jgi:hypothetical protein
VYEEVRATLSSFERQRAGPGFANLNITFWRDPWLKTMANDRKTMVNLWEIKKSFLKKSFHEFH